MEFELNAQYYLDVVLRQWKVVLVVFIVATLAALAVSFIQEPVYEATVSMMEQAFDYVDVPRLSLVDRTVIKLYPTLARSEAVESRVIEALGPSLSAAEKAPGTLMSMVSIREDRDNPALFRIRVQASDPGKARLIANTWAEQYIEELGSFQLMWKSELETVQQNLESAEAALTEFRQETGL
jgi:capsular polysaccharide biosynthesis protein